MKKPPSAACRLIRRRRRRRRLRSYQRRFTHQVPHWAAAEAGLGTRDLAGVGVGSPGDADEKTGIVSDARNLPAWTGAFPLGENLSEQLGVPVRLGNDVTVAVQGEFELGAGKEFDTIL